MTERTDPTVVRRAVAPRPDDAHKGTMGTLLSVCGSYGMAGACLLSSMAALRCGIGLLKCALPKSDGRIAAGSLPYLLAQPSDAVLLGCGMGNCEDTRTLVRGFLKRCDKPMVLDADALNAICDDPAVLKSAKAPVIITPHPAEMARLLGTTAKAVNTDRAKTARAFAARFGVITVLKGNGTVIAAPNGKAFLNPTGNSGMATGGSGDVLAGMCASLLAQGQAPLDCAAAAVYLHGLAGDLAAKRLGKISMLPTDIIDEIPSAFRACTAEGNF